MFQEIPVPLQQSRNGECFPLALQPESAGVSLEEVVNWGQANAALVEQQASQHGAVLFRGLPVTTAEDFDQFISSFGFVNFEYRNSLSNAVRTNFTERVFSANEAPSNVTIYLHHEMAQTPVFPAKLFFFCQKAAEEGGATPLCRSDWLFEEMVQKFPQFASACESRGLKYTTVMPGQDDAASGMGRSWQSTFRADQRSAAEQKMTELNYSWEWLDDGCLKATTPVLPAVHTLPDGRRVFFNQLIAAFRGWKDSRNDPSKAITFGDGTALDGQTVLDVADLAEQLTFDMPWQTTDVVVIDNFVAMHGRRTFSGTRKVLASLAEATTHE